METFMKKALSLPIILLASITQTALPVNTPKEPEINMKNITGELYPLRNTDKEKLKSFFTYCWRKPKIEEINKGNDGPSIAITADVSHTIKEDPRILDLVGKKQQAINLDAIAMFLKLKDENNTFPFAHLIIFGNEQKVNGDATEKEGAIIGTTFNKKDANHEKSEEAQLGLLRETKEWIESRGYCACIEASRSETDADWEKLGIPPCRNHRLTSYAKLLFSQ